MSSPRGRVRSALCLAFATVVSLADIPLQGSGGFTNGPAIADAGSVPISSAAPPSVTLTSPANGQTFTAPGSVTLEASASDADGRVVRVDFFVGDVVVASAQAPPYTAAWNNGAP